MKVIDQENTLSSAIMPSVTGSNLRVTKKKSFKWSQHLGGHSRHFTIPGRVGTDRGEAQRSGFVLESSVLQIVSFSSVTDRSPMQNTLAYSRQRRWRRRKKGVYNTLTTFGRFHKHVKHVAYESSIISYAHLSIYCMHVVWHAASMSNIGFAYSHPVVFIFSRFNKKWLRNEDEQPVNDIF